jgi:hypothetical protein
MEIIDANEAAAAAAAAAKEEATSCCTFRLQLFLLH